MAECAARTAPRAGAIKNTVQAVTRLYREARRRKVFRTAALYVVGAWAALQAAALGFPGFGIPEAAIRAAIWAAVLGFPVALVFGWLFEIGPGGIRRTLPAAAGEAAEPRRLARRDYVLLAAFACIALALLYQAIRGVRDTPAERTAADVAANPATAGRLENSIAVLPFANMSNDPDNGYFCDGVSEEILNALSGFRELNVIGRTSSFAFKDSNVGIERITEVLGVRHVLQGSVRKAGGQLRISAQLLDAGGRQIWTQNFDRQLANVFDIQSEIAAAVAAKVAAHVTSRTASGYHPDLEAYDHYLAGREFLHARNTERALEQMQRAIEIDPEFAEAQVEWAIARLMGSPSKEQSQAAQSAIDRALALQPQLLRARAARAFGLLQSGPQDPVAAERMLREVLAQEPSMSDALLWLSNALGDQGRTDDQLAVLQRAVRIDPLHPSIAGNLAAELVQQGEVPQAIRVLERQLDQPRPPLGPFYALANLHQQLGDLVEFNATAKRMALRGPLDNPWMDHYLLAASYGLVGDWRTAEYWLDRLARDYPDAVLRDLGPPSLPGWQGRDTDALIVFRKLLDDQNIGIDSLPELRVWYGALLARAGEHAAAIEVLEPLTAPDASADALLSAEPQYDGEHALAWAYRGSGADAKAEALLSADWSECKGRLAAAHATSDVVHRCAETALLRGDREQALTLFDRAVTAGWRDYYWRQRDVYWAPLANDPRYRALMTKVKADVDRQAAEIARIDASEDFVAKFDSVMAARKSAGSEAGR
jgi:TolB-like protein